MPPRWRGRASSRRAHQHFRFKEWPERSTQGSGLQLGLGLRSQDRVTRSKLLVFCRFRKTEQISSMPAAFDLLDGFVDEPLVVFLGEVPLDDLRGDHHREIDRLMPDLLQRARRL